VLLVVCACGRLGFESESSSPSAPGPLGGTKGTGSTLEQGLVAHLSLDGTLLDDVTSTDADCSGAECPSFVAGVSGEAAHFDGAATCVHVPWLASWSPAQYTVTAWIQPEAMSGPVVVREHDTSCPSPSLLSSNAAVGFIGTDAATGHQEAWSSAVLSPGTWMHVAIEFDGAMQSVFVGGGCACQVAPQIQLAYASYELTIGCYPAASTWFTGAIDDVHVYDRVLSPDEVAILAGGASPVDCAATCSTVQP
jgi:hypothetical protein